MYIYTIHNYNNSFLFCQYVGGNFGAERQKNLAAGCVAYTPRLFRIIYTLRFSASAPVSFDLILQYIQYLTETGRYK